MVALSIAACGPTRVTIAPVAQPTTALEAEQLYAKFGVAGVRSGNAVLGATEKVLDSTHVDALLLNDGTEIEDPRDLIPILRPDSKAIALANGWAAGREKWAVPGAFASVTAALGFGGAIVSLMTINQVKSAVPTVVSLVTLIIGPIVSLSIGKMIAPDVDLLLTKAFQAYLLELEGVRAAAAPSNAPPPGAP